MSRSLRARLIATADTIDNRLGPISGAAADQLARLLREAARAVPQEDEATPQGGEAAVVGEITTSHGVIKVYADSPEKFGRTAAERPVRVVGMVTTDTPAIGCMTITAHPGGLSIKGMGGE